MTDIFIVIYLNDILIFSNSLEEHQVHVRRVLERLREYDLHSKPEKCLFHTQKIKFLGFMVTPLASPWTRPRLILSATGRLSRFVPPAKSQSIDHYIGDIGHDLTDSPRSH